MCPMTACSGFGLMVAISLWNIFSESLVFMFCVSSYSSSLMHIYRQEYFTISLELIVSTFPRCTSKRFDITVYLKSISIGI